MTASLNVVGNSCIRIRTFTEDLMNQFVMESKQISRTRKALLVGAAALLSTILLGAICITQPDRLPEAGGLRVLTSDFLLIRVAGPQVVWRQAMSALGAGDNGHFEWASAVIECGDKNIRVVVPTKLPELAVYEVALPDNSSVASAS